jgi:endonuclease-3
MSLQRSSMRITRLAARASPYHPSVTLYEKDPDVINAGPSPKRRKFTSKAEGVDPNTSPDIEDIVLEKPPSDAPARASSSSHISEKARKIVSPRKAKPIKQALDIPHPAPNRWQETYDTIKEMRSRIVAPVDTMGCDQAQLKELDPKVRVLLLCWVCALKQNLGCCRAKGSRR